MECQSCRAIRATYRVKVSDDVCVIRRGAAYCACPACGERVDIKMQRTRRLGWFIVPEAPQTMVYVEGWHVEGPLAHGKSLEDEEA